MRVLSCGIIWIQFIEMKLFYSHPAQNTSYKYKTNYNCFSLNVKNDAAEDVISTKYCYYFLTHLNYGRKIIHSNGVFF